MTLRPWLNNHGTLVLLAVLLVTACATTISVATRLGAASSLRDRTEQLTARLEEERPGVEPSAAPSSNEAQDPGRILAQRITARNLFTNPPQPQFRNVIGVLGDAALYSGGDMLAIGQQREGATLKAVGADYVEFEFEGETIRVDVLAQGGGEGGGPSQGARRRGPGGGGAGQFGGPPGPGGPGPRGGNDDPRAAFRERMQNMTPEQMEEMRARFRSERGQGGGGGGGGENRRGQNDGARNNSNERRGDRGESN